MEKILIACIMFLIVMAIKDKIDKETKGKLEKELKKAVSGKINPKRFPKDCEKILAKVMPEDFKKHQGKLKKGLVKIAEITSRPDEIAEYKSAAKQKKLLA